MFVKICGITREQDARAAVAYGASAIGFVLWPKSPRYVDPSTAQAIVRVLPPFVTPVGVFVNTPIDQVNAVADEVGLGVVQLHGDETAAEARHSSRPVVKAISRIDLDAALAWADRVMLLVDADDPERRGGTGAKADWAAAAVLARERRILLAGGIDAGNVAEAIRTVRPFGIDVSSGVEDAPGIKSARRLEALFEAVRAGAADL
jgi:phosphoribosylanthranilate isomerase